MHHGLSFGLKGKEVLTRAATWVNPRTCVCVTDIWHSKGREGTGAAPCVPPASSAPAWDAGRFSGAHEWHYFRDLESSGRTALSKMFSIINHLEMQTKTTVAHPWSLQRANPNTRDSDRCWRKRGTADPRAVLLGCEAVQPPWRTIWKGPRREPSVFKGLTESPRGPAAPLQRATLERVPCAQLPAASVAAAPNGNLPKAHQLPRGWVP